MHSRTTLLRRDHYSLIRSHLRARAIAMPAHNISPDPALAFVKFVSDSANLEAWKVTGFELMEGNN